MDNIDNLIIDRLGERQRKIDFITRNYEKKASLKSWQRKVYVIMSVAACAALIFTISPLLLKQNSVSDISISAPSFDQYRGAGGKDIELLIETGNFEEALIQVNSELEMCETELSVLAADEVSSEEKKYITTLHIIDKDELLWCKIYLLVKLGKKSDIEKMCDNYLKDNRLTIHREEVKQLLKKI
ncbi:MAG: hypothetical protein NC453_20380 [Muribaculum sp.]|nr:hypothetical protein [Muribaculum sp.]